MSKFNFEWCPRTASSCSIHPWTLFCARTPPWRVIIKNPPECSVRSFLSFSERAPASPCRGRPGLRIGRKVASCNPLLALYKRLPIDESRDAPPSDGAARPSDSLSSFGLALLLRTRSPPSPSSREGGRPRGATAEDEASRAPPAGPPESRIRQQPSPPGEGSLAEPAERHRRSLPSRNSTGAGWIRRRPRPRASGGLRPGGRPHSHCHHRLRLLSNHYRRGVGRESPSLSLTLRGTSSRRPSVADVLTPSATASGGRPRSPSGLTSLTYTSRSGADSAATGRRARDVVRRGREGRGVHRDRSPPPGPAGPGGYRKMSCDTDCVRTTYHSPRVRRSRHESISPSPRRRGGGRDAG